ncbi:MAG: alpha-keto acid decarboxylase family protein [Gammaproteobacteria bacterium]|nr:alpha-keto acid decarboxylase family protein [Gammaproteobacteria bacterium]
MNVSEYLLSRLKSLNVDHAFGVPGDFILPFFQQMSESAVTHIATCNELNAGYAADGYARLRGLGVVIVTYGPGAFSIVNAVAGAHAEDVPLLVVSGGPASLAYKASDKPVLHHLLTNNYEASIKVFEQVCEHAVLLNDPETVISEIDRAIEICCSRKKPVYLEIPKDIQVLDIGSVSFPENKQNIDTHTLTQTDGINALVDRIKSSKRTVFLPGHEIHRWGLQEKILQLMQKTGIPAASMFVGKSEYLEHSPLCLGAYQGAAGTAEVRDYIEAADTVIYLGAVPSDLNLGGFTARLSPEQTVTIWNKQLDMKEGSFSDLSISPIIDGLLANLPANLMNDGTRPIQSFLHKPDSSYEAISKTPITSQRFYDRLANFFQEQDIVLADASCAFNLTHLQMPANTDFIASNYWASIGMGFGAALGACFSANSRQRVIAVEGDGSFQMTAQELSSMIRYAQKPIIFLINNKGYTAERFIHDGDFNDIPQWRYSQLPHTFGGGSGIEVHTEDDLEAALKEAEKTERDQLLLIEVHIDAYDVSEGFNAMCTAIRGH